MHRLHPCVKNLSSRPTLFPSRSSCFHVDIPRPPQTSLRVSQDAARHQSNEAEASGNLASLPSASNSSPATIALKLPLVPGQRKPKDENIIVDSMHDTIEAHREANLSKIIRKYESQDLSDNSRLEQHLEPDKNVGYTVESSKDVDAEAPKQRLPRFRKIVFKDAREPTHLNWLKRPGPYERMARLDYACTSQER